MFLETRRLRRTIVVPWLGLLSLAFASSAGAGIGTVHAAKFKAKGSEHNSGGVVPARWDERRLINHIKEQPANAPVPKNHILAAQVACSDVPEFQLVVWDKDQDVLLPGANPIVAFISLSVPSNKKAPGSSGSKRDVVFSGVSSFDSVIRYSGVMQFTYKALPRKFNTPSVCPTKGKSLTLKVTLENVDADAVLTGKLKLGKLLEVQ